MDRQDIIVSKREPVKPGDVRSPRAVFTCDTPNIPRKASLNMSCPDDSFLNAEVSRPERSLVPERLNEQPSDEEVVKATVDRLTGKKREPVKPGDVRSPRAVFTCDTPNIPRKASLNMSCPDDSLSNSEVSRPERSLVPERLNEQPSDEEVVKATVDRLTGKVVTPEDAAMK
ncbi:hypothetical protein COOONC_22065 [Cooperia oncophora]